MDTDIIMTPCSIMHHMPDNNHVKRLAKYENISWRGGWHSMRNSYPLDHFCEYLIFCAYINKIYIPIYGDVATNGPLIRYAKLRVAHAPGMPGTFFPLRRVSARNMNHGTCVRHVPWCIPGSLTGGFFWSRWRGQRSRHSQRMHKS